MINPDPAAPVAANEMCIPAAALAIEGTAPAVDDEVEFVTRARVTRVEGEEIYASPLEVNGQPVKIEAEATEPSGDDIMEMARQADSAM